MSGSFVKFSYMNNKSTMAKSKNYSDKHLNRKVKILVTGGAGFIGSHVVEALLRNNAEVIVLDDLSTGSLINLEGLDVCFVQGSILDASLLDRLTIDMDAVVHLAALVSVPLSFQKPLLCSDINVSGTLNVLNSCKKNGVSRFIQASSSAVYGDLPGLPKTEEMPVAPMSPYASSKLSAEKLASSYATSGVSCSSLRFFNVYGPRQDPTSAYSGVISIFTSCLSKREPIKIYGDGGQTRDFIYVGDVASHVVGCLNRTPQEHEILNIATGTSTSLIEIVRILGDVTGLKSEVTFDDARKGDIYHSSASVEKLRRLDPHLPITFKDGICKYFDYPNNQFFVS